jgi:hypothetical protein
VGLVTLATLLVCIKAPGISIRFYSVLKIEHPLTPFGLEMDQFCTHFVVNGMQTGSLRYSRLGNLRYDEVPFRTLSSCAHYTMSLYGNCVVAKSIVT